MTHSDIVARAVRWLEGSQRCNVVLSGIASCSEIPDAIGWSTRSNKYGSIVVECKTSLSDFHADEKKYLQWENSAGWKFSRKRFSEAVAKRDGYKSVEISCMGRWRYFLCPADILSPELIGEHRPDHGLLVAADRGLKMLREAPLRPNPDLDAEIRLLQFALVHTKKNLLAKGFLVNMARLVMFRGSDGIEMPTS